jgi:cytochrome c556
MREKTIVRGALAVALGAAVSAVAMTATEAIQQRQQAMEAVGDAMKTLGAIAKQEQPFDVEVVQASAATIASHLEEAAELFPEGSDSGDARTWAKPEIWTDRVHFDEVLQRTHRAALDLQSVTEEEAFLPALGALGNGCKSCHDPYRLPKK